MRRFIPGPPRFDRLKETATFFWTTAFASALVAAATVGMVIAFAPNEALLRHGWAGGWLRITVQDGLCAIVTLLGIVPGILVWTGERRISISTLQPKRLAELILLTLLLISASLIVFTRDTPLYLHSALFLVPMLFLIWSGVRFGARGAATALLAVVCISAWGAYQSVGPFVGRSAADRAVPVQLFWVLLALPDLSLAAAIEERKQAEKTWLRGRRRYELATAAGRVAVWTYNYRTEEFFEDPSLAVMLGYGPGDAKSCMEWLRLVHSDDVKPVLEREQFITSPDAPGAASGETVIPEIQYRIRCANGSFRWVSNRGTLYRHAEDPPLAVGTITDISDLKEAQEASLARQKLESLGLLAGGIAHDFNDLPGTIHTEAELAECEMPAGSPVHNELRMIKTISIRASEIVRQLMIYAGHEKSEFERVDLSRLVNKMLALLRISMAKSAVLQTDLADSLPVVLGNDSQLRQVVMNLVLNASDAPGKKSGVIRVATGNAAGAGNTERYVTLIVSDTGSGISKEEQDRIFDLILHYQVRRARSRPGGGSRDRSRAWRGHRPGQCARARYDIPNFFAGCRLLLQRDCVIVESYRARARSASAAAPAASLSARFTFARFAYALQ
jgi:PAS domain S-box-containing protein